MKLIDRLLLKAAKSGQTKLVKMLLAMHANINVLDHHGNSPLLLAASNKHSGLAKTLIKKGAKIDNLNSITIFASYIFKAMLIQVCEAEHNEDIDLVEKLLALGVNIETTALHGDTPLLIVIGNGNLQLAKFLIENGANPNAQDIYGRSPLHLVCSSYSKNNQNDIQILKLLLEKKANLNAIDNDHDTPLVWAIDHRLNTQRDILIKHGARLPNLSSIEAPSDHLTNHYQLLQAAKYGHTDLVRSIILEGTVNTDVLDHTGMTPLMHAIQKQSLDVVKLLVDLGKANLEVKNEQGRTALVLAATFGQKEIVSFLLSSGANKDSCDNENTTALFIAVCTRNTEIARDLIRADANLNICDSFRGNSPLMMAVYSSPIATDPSPIVIVRELVEKGADFELVNKAGKTALDIAITNDDCPELIKFLKELSNIRYMQRIRHCTRMMSQMSRDTDHEINLPLEILFKISEFAASTPGSSFTFKDKYSMFSLFFNKPPVKKDDYENEVKYIDNIINNTRVTI